MWEFFPTFVVILDKPAFVTEPGVRFLMNDVRPDDVRDHRCPLAEFRRSAGIPQVARRLAMLGWKKIVGDALRERSRNTNVGVCLVLLWGSTSSLRCSRRNKNETVKLSL